MPLVFSLRNIRKAKLHKAGGFTQGKAPSERTSVPRWVLHSTPLDCLFRGLGKAILNIIYFILKIFYSLNELVEMKNIATSHQHAILRYPYRLQAYLLCQTQTWPRLNSRFSLFIISFNWPVGIVNPNASELGSCGGKQNLSGPISATWDPNEASQAFFFLLTFVEKFTQ